MAVLDPVRLVLTNYPSNEEEILPAVNNPEDPSAGCRMLPFGRELWIERNDFREDPPRDYYPALLPDARSGCGMPTLCVSSA